MDSFSNAFPGVLDFIITVAFWETHQYFATFVDGRGGKPPAILAKGLTPEDSRLKPVTSLEPREYAHVLPIELTLRATNYQVMFSLGLLNCTQGLRKVLAT